MISACMWVVLIPVQQYSFDQQTHAKLQCSGIFLSFSSILHFLRKFQSTYFPCYLTFATLKSIVWHSVIYNYFPLYDLCGLQAQHKVLIPRFYNLYCILTLFLISTIKTSSSCSLLSYPEQWTVSVYTIFLSFICSQHKTAWHMSI